MELAGAAVVAEPFPEPQDILFGSLGQAFDRRKADEEPAEKFLDPFHLGLLEHDFAHPDAVGIPVFPPGQAAAGPAIPGEQ